MKETILAKYGEIALKGLNKSTFEDILIKNIKRRLKNIGKFKISKMQSTLYITPDDEISEKNINLALSKLTKVFGIGALQRCLVLPKDFDEIVKQGMPYLKESLSKAKTFKVEAKRSDKAFPMNSPMIQRELGGEILSAYPHLKVDVHNPDITVLLEIRDVAAYLNAERLIGAKGMPVGSAGRSLLLLSGGIDSPVAGYMMAKRGLIVDALHFVSPPYTSDRARLKVEQLAQRLTNYCNAVRFYCVPFTKIQEEIRFNCPDEFFTIIMRRLMMEIANRICEKDEYGAIITGESVGQVASQTLGALQCTNEVARFPVFRPVIGMDKDEIVDISRKIDTYEISIQPYEDCCTVFTPKHPKTKPILADILKAEGKFDFEPLIDQAVEETEVKMFYIED
ncbi:MAG: tRNA 4-thiouridine(8) synthase ThiI [Clostridiales bacterium]|nr:tRNA 4-thiouridine(8) synthase ThiI [Clostridiales bacterium]